MTWLEQARDDYIDELLTLDQYEDVVAMLLALEVEDQQAEGDVSRFVSMAAGVYGRPERIQFAATT